MLLKIVKAIELNPNYALAYLYRGSAYRNIGRYEEAFKDYQKSIWINPAYPDVYHNRGYAYLLLKKYEDALRDINKALELDPNSVRALHRRGLVYNQLKDYKGAIRDFSKAIELEKITPLLIIIGHSAISRPVKPMNPQATWRKLPNLVMCEPERLSKNRDTIPYQFNQGGEYV